MNPVYTYYGKVEGGSLQIFNNRSFRESLSQFEGKQVEIILRRRRKARSLEQNAYYWGVIVPVVQEGLKDLGWDLDKAAVHDFLKEKFNRVELVNEKTGEIWNATGSTTRMSTVDMMAYFQVIQQWSAEYLSVYIPNPGEQVQIEFKTN